MAPFITQRFPLHMNGNREILRYDPVEVIDNAPRFEIQTELSEWLVSRLTEEMFPLQFTSSFQLQAC